MPKQIFCPHFVEYGGTTRMCMKGRFPCDCDVCDCPDKQLIDVKTTTSTVFVDESKEMKHISTVLYGLDGCN